MLEVIKQNKSINSNIYFVYNVNDKNKLQSCSLGMSISYTTIFIYNIPFRLYFFKNTLQVEFIYEI